MSYYHDKHDDVVIKVTKNEFWRRTIPVSCMAVSPDTTINVCIQDAIALETKDNIKTFVESNCNQYYICINTWVLLAQDILGRKAAIALEDTITHHGLLSTIAICDAMANNLIARLDGTKEWQDLPTWVVSLSHVLLHDTDDALTLQVLRFPKRFTIIDSETLKSKSEDSFKDLLFKTNWVKVARHSYESGETADPDVSGPDYGFMGELVKKYVHKFLEYFDPERVPNNPWVFSKGICKSVSGKTLRGPRAKMKELNNYTHLFHCTPYGMPGYDQCIKDWYIDTIQVMGVPKSYKVYRMIAPEDVVRAVHNQQIRQELERAFSLTAYCSHYRKEDQSVNSELARISSVDGSYATLDQSSASDSYARRLAEYLLPRRVWSVVEPWLPKWIKVGKIRYTASIFLTSGDPNTFDFESLTFLAICFAARELHYIWTRRWAKKPQVYGDDIIVDVNTVDEVLSILAKLGFTVNESKSFWAGRYRESCGAEFYAGYDVSTCYWPRKAIAFDARNAATTLASLTSLQHKLIKYAEASRFLCCVVRACMPDMTYSEIGTDCTDLWAPINDAPTCFAPFDRKRVSKDDMIEMYGDVVLRGRHKALRGKADKTYKSDPGVQLYYYYTFLAHGPYYPDGLSELLGVSESRISDISPELPVEWGTVIY